MSIDKYTYMARQYTKWQFDELLKCRKSFRYFSENYLQITHPKQGLVPFKLYKFQERVIKEFDEYQFCIVKKFRQAGLTTVTCMWMLWKSLFFNDQRILIASKTDREARAVGKLVAQAKNQLPDWLKPEMGNDNDHEKEFIETGSIMWFFTPSAARSRALTYLIIDEAAFVQGMEEHWKAMYPTLSTGGNAIIISTVNGIGGIGGWYHDQYQKAYDKHSQFHIVHIDWREHPDYNNDIWEARTRANIGEKGFAQEYEGSFLGSGDTYIPSEVLKEYELLCIDPIHKALPEWDHRPEEDADEISESGVELPSRYYEPGAFWIWEKSRPGKEYIIAADAAEGVGGEGDFCAFVVLDVNNLTQVAEFYSNTIPTYKFAQVLKSVGDLYNTALLVIENSMGPGQAVCERLQHSLSYENLYFTQTTTRDRAGVNMNKVVRPICLEAMQTCMLNRLVKIRSIRLMRELKTFIYNSAKQRAEASKGKHDDLVISLAVALHISDVMNREMPVLTHGNQDEMDLITRTLFNEDFDKLRIELEEGVSEDILEEDIDIDIDLLPKIMFATPKRPFDKIMKEFGW